MSPCLFQSSCLSAVHIPKSCSPLQTWHDNSVGKNKLYFPQSRILGPFEIIWRYIIPPQKNPCLYMWFLSMAPAVQWDLNPSPSLPPAVIFCTRKDKLYSPYSLASQTPYSLIMLQIAYCLPRVILQCTMVNLCMKHSESLCLSSLMHYQWTLASCK